MSRWGKTIVVPLDSLCKEKESTNRPTVARSVGTVGKWGKMGFTSTRTYALSALPAAMAAAAAAVAASTPSQSPASALDDDLSPSIPEPPKPKKFFKSRNTTPPEVIAQMLQQLPRVATSPTRDSSHNPSYLSTPVLGSEPMKMKICKSNSAERKKKSTKKLAKAKKSTEDIDDDDIESLTPKQPSESKSKKKKEVKKIKPEAPPSRIIPRARKAINYCEDYDDERTSTPIKDIIIPKVKEKVTDVLNSLPVDEPALPPPATPSITSNQILSTVTNPTAPVNMAPKTPEHPPIVLRISKGISRLVSTDSEEQPTNASNSPHQHDIEGTKSRHASTEEVPVPPLNVATVLPTTPKIIVKPPKPPSPEPPPLLNENDEINYCTVKISPDKPPKERLKIIIKTNVIRKANAAAAAEKANSADTATEGDRHEKEKKQRSKKHKHPKHTSVEHLIPAASTSISEFKTPSPHLALGLATEQQQPPSRTIISPPALSERDFDSQSSVLGSISSKGNSTPQLQVQTPQEESCVVRSRGSSVITSDLETSQHSSLVAAPSDIESRLESMMMDGENSQRSINLLEAEPLQEDILAILRGDDTQANDIVNVKVNGTNNEGEGEIAADEDVEMQDTKRRTRGRGREPIAVKANCVDEEEEMPAALKAQPATRTRGRKPQVNVPLVAQEAPTLKRTTRRGAKKPEEVTATVVAMEIEELSPNKYAAEDMSPNKSEEENLPTQPTARRGRTTRSAKNNNNLSTNNNINKIADNLSAKADASNELKASTINTSQPTLTTQSTQRSYGRKRKNQQVTKVLQPTEEDDDAQQMMPAKIPNIEVTDVPGGTTTTSVSPSPELSAQKRHTSTVDLHDANSNSNSLTRPSSTTPISPPRRDYKIKDKFKRTLTLDNQVNCNAVVASNANSLCAENAGVGEEEQQRGSVKLVISKKKGSIFKSRALVPPEQSEQSSVAKRHLYKHSWDAQANGGTRSDGTASPAKSNNTQGTVPDDFSEDFNPIEKLTRVVKPNPQANPFDIDIDAEKPADTITSIKVDRKAKEYYTVVRNVKAAHQIQEIGEYQEMDDDVEYILDALQPHNPTPTRCLSALQLATKCMTPAFRMHVRAHGVVTKFFKALSDANKNLSLGLCTSAIMYILSQEGLNMDLDRDALELMMNLLESESVAAPSDRANYERNKQKVRELCEEIKLQGKGTHLNVDSISVGTLAMETLLSLTSKRAGEWFKEELRELGGLEQIIKTICDSCRPIITCSEESLAINWTHSLLENIQTVERCMRVLENVTQMNEENQKYILNYAKGGTVKTLCTLYRLCDRELVLHPTSEHTAKDDPGVLLRQVLIPLMKVLINLTHTFNPANAVGPEVVGQQKDLIEISFHLLLQAPNYIPDKCVFELSILVLLLLINLSMHNIPNRTAIIKAYAPSEFGLHYDDQQTKMTAVQALMEYFYKCEELARLVEKNTDAILDNTEKNKKKQEEVDETVNNLLQKAGHHMEHTLKGSYTGILIGHLITDNEEYEAVIRTHLHGNGFKELVSVLEKYYTFMNLTASSEASVVAHIKSTKKIIDYFKKRDLVNEMNEPNDSALPLNLDTSQSNVTDTSPSTSTGASGSTRSNAQRVYKTYSSR
ncbi:protein wings apart-like [Teleopsis dalmanni]|uniref:protein wings apart-like n=1 Tax=Teleopsis dalmanni TaxID=139649 RepID=UPI0018CFA5B2|nr:protein wings apart-like [Teleopsis dalmanni]